MGEPIAKTRVTENNQTTIPRAVRLNTGIEGGDQIEWYHERNEDGEYIWRIKRAADGDDDQDD